MFKKKRCHQPRILISARHKRRTIGVVTLALTLALAGGIVTQLRGIPLSVATHAPVLPQATPTPTSLAKEYVYAGDRLLATVELLEADVDQQPEGSGSVTTVDWVKLGRFASGLDIPTAGSEFQRVDCAPRTTRGNNIISISDWVQAGRYAAGLDPPTVAWGPIGTASSGFVAPDGVFFAMAFPSASLAQVLTKSFGNMPLLGAATTRTVRIVSPNFVAGQNGTVIIELDSQGDENAVGLSLTFNTAQLTFVSAVKGGGATNATLNVNSGSAGSGRVGIVLAQSSNQTFVAGTRQAVVVTFTASSSGAHVVSSGNQPVWREVADVNANTLAATFTP